MNLTILSGRFCTEPTLKETNGKKYVSISLAVDRPKKQDGTKTADFIECVFWNSKAEAISKYCKKGHKIGIIGSIRTSKYQKQDGTTINKTVVYVSNIDFHDNRPKTETQTQFQAQTAQLTEQVQAQVEEDPYEAFANEITITDDMLPFD